jgi:hypothetical protein
MKADTIRALFSKQNENLCNYTLSDCDTWLNIKFGDDMHGIAFRKEADVRILISTAEQRKTQDQVKSNDYASRISKRSCSDNPNEAT